MEDREFYWDWGKHEDQVFTSRGSFFLVAEAMFFAGIAALLGSSSSNQRAVQIILCLAGLIVTVIWLWVDTVHIYKTQRVIKAKLKELEPRWSEVASARRKYASNHFLMGIILPASLLVLWAIMIFL